MIYLRLAGGLGNQLYQIAAAILVSDASNLPIAALTDALDSYAAKRAADSLRLINLDAKLATILPHPVPRVLSTILRAGRWLRPMGINDGNFWESLPSLVGRRVILMDGYFQAGWPLEELLKIISRLGSMLRVQPDARSAIVADCCVHVRGGDFLRHAVHSVVDARYYEAAIQAALASGARSFMVVSDDQGYARAILTPVFQRLGCRSVRFEEPASDPLTDFSLLTTSPLRVIGNSTFAWWAAALDSNRGITWSPCVFGLNAPRDTALPWERLIANA